MTLGQSSDRHLGRAHVWTQVLKERGLRGSKVSSLLYSQIKILRRTQVSANTILSTASLGILLILLTMGASSVPSLMGITMLWKSVTTSVQSLTCWQRNKMPIFGSCTNPVCTVDCVDHDRTGQQQVHRSTQSHEHLSSSSRFRQKAWSLI